MDLVALQIFSTVVEQGGINKAAAKLHRVPSNVTTRVKQLEERLGARLFVREKRRLVLTPEGRLLLTYAEQLLRLSAEAESALRRGKPQGLLRIGALESTAAVRLPPLLSHYHRAFPDVRIELVTGTSGSLVSRLREQDLEAAFVAEPFNARDLETQAVFVEELVLITPKAFGPVRLPRDIGTLTVIGFASDCSYRRRLEGWLRTGNAVPGRAIEFQSYHAIVACVAAGSGMAIVPRSVIELSPGKREVVVNRLPVGIARANTRLAWRPGYRSIALEAMKTLLAGSGRARLH